ncbi:MAG: hypothetical protein DWI57_15425 [Chloroflexi bacterium]|nr:MAG: hypothetical protein DWI57_15425 [Chloroflexota bacterium]
MLLTLDLPDQIVNHLENKASVLELSVNAFTSRLLESVLYAPQDADSHFIYTLDQSSPTDSLRELTAKIAASPPDPSLIEPATKTIAEFLLELENDPPLSDEDSISPPEWNRLWAEFEREMKEIDLADEIADGRR